MMCPKKKNLWFPVRAKTRSLPRQMSSMHLSFSLIRTHRMCRIEFYTLFNGNRKHHERLISLIVSSIYCVRGYLADIDHTDDDACENNHGIHWIQGSGEISTQSISKNSSGVRRIFNACRSCRSCHQKHIKWDYIYLVKSRSKPKINYRLPIARHINGISKVVCRGPDLQQFLSVILFSHTEPC
jgi:hypothetical protein